MEPKRETRERRGFPRINSRYRLMLALQPTQGEVDAPTAAIDAVSRDISRGGVGVEAEHSAPPRTRCLIRFYGTEGQVSPDLTWGIIRRVEEIRGGFLLGIEFDTPLETLRLSTSSSLSGLPRDATLADAPERTPAERDPDSDEDAQSYRVLIADDEEPIRELLREFLARRGYDAESVKDGQEALLALRERDYDAILIDLFLPKLSGLDLLRFIEEESLSAGAILAMSGYHDDEAKEVSFRLGAQGFVGKPINLRNLEETLESALKGQRPH
jgi:CheY-like chemotaxis protein